MCATKLENWSAATKIAEKEIALLVNELMALGVYVAVDVSIAVERSPYAAKWIYQVESIFKLLALSDRFILTSDLMNNLQSAAPNDYDYNNVKIYDFFLFLAPLFFCYRRSSYSLFLRLHRIIIIQRKHNSNYSFIVLF